MNECNKHESRGTWTFERIGRPDVWYDQRSKFDTNLEEFDKSMKEQHTVFGEYCSTTQDDLIYHSIGADAE